MGARLSHVFMVVSDLEAQRRLLVDVVGLHVLLDEGEYVRIGGDGGFNLGLEEGVRGSSYAFKLGGGANARRRVRFPSASATEKAL